MEKKKSRFGIGLVIGILIALAAVLLFATVGFFLFMRGPFAGSTELSYQEKLKLVQTYLDTYFLGELNEQEIEDGMVAGYLSGTGDKYAKYYSKKEFDQLMEEVAGSYGGIGVGIIETTDGKIEVYKVYEGSPAEDAGIQVQDFIVEADGVRDFKDLDELVSIVRGESGTTVNIVVERDGTEIPMTLERRKIDIDTVESKMLDNNIGYIQLTEFESISVSQFNEALEDLERQGMTSLILDLRDNPGGDYDTVISLADRILPEGRITTVVNNQGEEKVEVSDDEHKIGIPMVLLVNENSASASELLSAAIKDFGTATIVGKTTYGKGIVQSIFRLPDGSGMKFTTEEYLSPNGNKINGIGVSPDVEIEIPESAYEDGIVEADEDTQLQKAIEILLGGTSVKAD